MIPIKDKFYKHTSFHGAPPQKNVKNIKKDEGVEITDLLKFSLKLPSYY